MMNKIYDFRTLESRIRTFQNTGERVILCYGVFNVLHIGHIRYLKQAAQLGDVLVVVLSMETGRDGNPSHDHDAMRAEALAYLEWVDAVTVNQYSNYRDMIEHLKPDIYAKGFESVQADRNLEDELKDEEFFQTLGIQLVLIKEEGFSSTNQINRYLTNYPEEVYNYLHVFRQRYGTEDLIGPLDQLEKLNVLVIGDTIIDEYQYCSAIGKSSKDPTLALKYESTDFFAGGILAVANHVANFAGHVDLMTVVGEINSYESYIRSALHKNVTPYFIVKPEAPTLIKRRFIDGYSMNKLFEVYVMDDSPLKEEQERRLCDRIDSKKGGYDMIIVGDFGHGAISSNVIDVLTGMDSFLAVNTQSNAGNRGFNTISKYPRADYVSLAEHEIRLETRDTTGRLFPMIEKLASSMNSRQFVVTRGKKGCMLCDRAGGLIQVPSFAVNIVDRVGAGDAFFALTALLSCLCIPGEILGFIGNIAGALAVETMGNQKYIDKERMIGLINELPC
jgi:cytidyltransferase-like protein